MLASIHSLSAPQSLHANGPAVTRDTCFSIYDALHNAMNKFKREVIPYFDNLNSVVLRKSRFDDLKGSPNFILRILSKIVEPTLGYQGHLKRAAKALKDYKDNHRNFIANMKSFLEKCRSNNLLNEKEVQRIQDKIEEYENVVGFNEASIIAELRLAGISKNPELIELSNTYLPIFGVPINSSRAAPPSFMYRGINIPIKIR